MYTLHELGWNSFFSQHCTENSALSPARVIEQQRALYRIAWEGGEGLAETSGRFRRRAVSPAELPAVGDWVLIEPHANNRPTIHEVLPRKSKFSRKAAGQETVEQVVAANIDFAFVVTSLNSDLNLRRLERYLATVWDSGAQPVVLLNKSDLCDEAQQLADHVASVASGAPIHVLSALAGVGLDPIVGYLSPGATVALLGSSGVGKSTLINRLLGESIQHVGEVREADDRGRHSTTSRRLFMLPGGGMLIDTPGMRELQLWDAREGLSQTFGDIETLARSCRFTDCRHQSEPGCAIQAALSQGNLAADRLESYLKLARELDFLDRKQDASALSEQNRKWKRIHKASRELYKNRDKP